MQSPPIPELSVADRNALIILTRIEIDQNAKPPTGDFMEDMCGVLDTLIAAPDKVAHLARYVSDTAHEQRRIVFSMRDISAEQKQKKLSEVNAWVNHAVRRAIDVRRMPPPPTAAK